MEFLTDIVKEKGIASIILGYSHFPCKNCGAISLDPNDVCIWGIYEKNKLVGDEYACYHSSCYMKTFDTIADKCKAIQLAISNDKKMI